MRRVFKKAVQQGRSERESEAYSRSYVEGLSDARTQLAAFFNTLLLKRDSDRHAASMQRRLVQSIDRRIAVSRDGSLFI